MPESILIIENDAEIALSVGNRLTTEGFRFETAPDGESGERMAASGAYLLIIVDGEIPPKGGLSVCRSLREAGNRTPILLLIDRNAPAEVQAVATDFLSGSIEAQSGAMDILYKPVDTRELLVKTRRILELRDSARPGDSPAMRKNGGVRIDLEHGSIRSGGIDYSLSAQEIKLLDYFSRHRGTTISREELLNTVWGYDSNIATRTIDVHVARLRHKMGDEKSVQRYIHTIRGVGYKFTPPED